MLRRQAGPLQYDYKGDKPMAVFHMLRTIDRLVGVAVSRNEVYAAMFGFVRAIGGGTFAARRLNARVRALADAAHRDVALHCVSRIELEDTGARVARAGSDDEVGMLQRSINAMGERIVS